jgi:NADH-quinone oxidoreductase subunit F
MIRFFKHESCGKCTPCREGTHWALKVYDKLISGEGTMDDVKMVEEVNKQITGKCFCPLGEFATSSMTFTLKHFRQDYLDLIDQKKGGREDWMRELARDKHLAMLHDGHVAAHDIPVH